MSQSPALSRKVTLGFAAGLCILLAVGLVSYLSITRLVRATDWVIHTHEVLDELDALLDRVDYAETSQRGYLITGEPSHLVPYRTVTDILDKKVQRLRTLTADNPAQQQR